MSIYSKIFFLKLPDLMWRDCRVLIQEGRLVNYMYTLIKGKQATPIDKLSEFCDSPMFVQDTNFVFSK